ncbi:hypothetical protein GGI21_006569, partial [Coemansia aciculifera]
SLFGGGGGGNKNKRPGTRMRDLNNADDDNDNSLLGGFDSSAAVPKTVAEHHYRHIYRKKQPASLNHATAQALGSAAAIKVLRSESHMSQQLRDSNIHLPDDLTHDQMMMGLVLSEVGDLLERKAETAQLEHDETMENVGKIALATIIKIKMDEDEHQPPPFPEKQPYTAYKEEPQRRGYSDHDSGQTHHQSRRHHSSSSAGPTSSSQPHRSSRHHRSETALNEKDSHNYVY